LAPTERRTKVEDRLRDREDGRSAALHAGVIPPDAYPAITSSFTTPTISIVNDHPTIERGRERSPANLAGFRRRPHSNVAKRSVTRVVATREAPAGPTALPILGAC
jgi:hypothetical protein